MSVLELIQLERDLKQAREEIEVLKSENAQIKSTRNIWDNKYKDEITLLKAKLEQAVKLATILDNNASHDCWPVKPEGCTCYLGDVRKQLNSITIDSIKRGE